jgi:small subunit ribosomal protein S6|tara:strand:- start:23746 stop:24237 length:492 start_codon:yes stop_codon:yes gene_type:complete
MRKYEATIILNPNLSSKVDNFLKDFEKLLKDNSFNILKTEDIGRRQLAYSIKNHNKGHYLIFNLEGDSLKLSEVENKIKYNETIIRYLFISVKEHSGEDSQLLIDSKNKKNDSESEENLDKKVQEKVNIESDKSSVKENEVSQAEENSEENASNKNETEQDDE